MRLGNAVTSRLTVNAAFCPRAIPQVEEFDFAAQNMFMIVEQKILATAEEHFENFRISPMFETLTSCLGPKMMTVRARTALPAVARSAALSAARL